MGQVFVANDTRLGRLVAVKVLAKQLASEPEARTRFEREAKAIAALSHPNICTLYDVSEDQGHPFLVMELLDGETLAARLARDVLPLQQAVAIATQIADVLHQAHASGVIHRDLKPANVMLTKSGTKLLDFGLAKLRERSPVNGFEETTTHQSLTASGTILGTLNYMSPEQVRGEEVDQRTDIFSLGCVLYEMVTGRMAFHGSNAASVMGAILERSPDPPTRLQPSIPVAVERIVLRCLEKDANARFSSAGDLKFALESAGWVTPLPAATLTTRSGAWLAAAGGLALVLAIAGVFYFRSNADPSAAIPLVFAIEPPIGKALSQVASYPSFAVSPDSKYLAFSVSDNAGSALALKRQDSVESSVLSGSEGGDLPFWSPDGRSLAFFAQGALKRLQIDSGVVEQICRVADVSTGALGGTWNEHGQILFSTTEGVMSVPAAGGTPSIVLTPREGASTAVAYRHPAWLPGQRHFLVSGIRGGDTSVYLGTSDGVEPRELIRGAARAVYSGTGHILFVREGNLFAQPFDAVGHSLRGSAMAVASGVAHQAGRAAFAVADTGLLVYRKQQPPSKFVWMDRAGNTVGAIGEPSDRLNPRISPDQQRVAFEQHDADGRGDIWFMDLRRQSLTRVTYDGTHAQRPVWSPDGTLVAYSDQALGLVIRSLDGTGPREQWAPTANSRRRPSEWTHDAKHVIFEDEGRDTKLDIWIVGIGEDSPRPLLRTQFSEYGARVSPNGRWMAYTSDESGTSEINVRRFPSTTGKTQISTAGGASPRWSPDGREIFYVARSGELTSVAVHETDELTVGSPKILFQVNLRGANGQTDYEVGTANRFLVNVLLPARSSLVGVYDWLHLLDEKTDSR